VIMLLDGLLIFLSWLWH